MESLELIDQQSFRAFLQGQYLQRAKRDHGYSLRAFARLLSIDPSLLSKYMKGHRRVSDKAFRQICVRLDAQPEDVFGFARPKHGRVEHQDYRAVSSDEFQLISNCSHYVVFEAFLLKDFQSSSEWLAERLGLSLDTVESTLMRLERLGLVDRSKTPWRRCTDLVTTTDSPFTTVAFRRMQHQLLEEARQTMEEVPMSERDQSSMTMAFDAKLLPVAKAKLAEFRREMLTLSQSSGQCDRVYHLVLSLFPATGEVESKRGEP